MMRHLLFGAIVLDSLPQILLAVQISPNGRMTMTDHQAFPHSLSSQPASGSMPHVKPARTHDSRCWNQGRRLRFLDVDLQLGWLPSRAALADGLDHHEISPRQEFDATRVSNLLCAVRDFVSSHRDALLVKGIFHCHISFNNLVLSSNTGMLLGFDAAERMNDIIANHGTALDLNSRAETRAFQSFKVLCQSDKLEHHDHLDDLESISYVLFYPTILQNLIVPPLTRYVEVWDLGEPAEPLFGARRHVTGTCVGV
ncbi:hypothetical protein C8R44DRAFT_926644 [Mycena epipterygia]|nr:hypothetical protein C8R44DRAFT_926644 [Mycena epipterygia]